MLRCGAKPLAGLSARSSLQPLGGAKTMLCIWVGVTVRMWPQALCCLRAGLQAGLCGCLGHCAGSLAARGCAPSWDRCWLGTLPARGCPSRPGFLGGWDWRLCLAVEQGRGCALLPGGAIERAHSWRRPLPGDLAQALRWADPDWDLYLCAAAGRSAVHQDLSAAKYMIV